MAKRIEPEPLTPLSAPFPWFGGKSRAGTEIWAALGEVTNYVEPFCGSLAALLTAPRIHHTETVNDADGFVANFWRATAMDPEAVARFADWPVNECCPAGTMIATPDGEIPIEQVRQGTVVWGEVSGRIVPTEVLGTRRSLASEFVTVGPLRVTPNHPVWTQERGYLEAKSLTAGLHVAIVDTELRTAKLAVLQSADDQPCLGDLHAIRSTNGGGAVCRGDIPRRAASGRAHVTCGHGRQDAPGLLDSGAGAGWPSAHLQRHRNGCGRSVEGTGAILDRHTPHVDQPGEPHGRWGGDSGVQAPHGDPQEVVGDEDGGEVCPGAHKADAWALALGGGKGQDCGGWSGSEAHGCLQGKAVAGAHRKETFRGAPAETPGRARGEAAECGASREDSPLMHKSQACGVYGDGGSVRLSHARFDGAGRLGGVGQPGHPEGRQVPGDALPLRVEVFNFQTTSGNYIANGVLVHNCDLEARHAWLVARSERLRWCLQDPEFYDAKMAGWWVWGQCSWIGTGWCSGEGPHKHNGATFTGNAGQGINRKLPHLGNAGQGINRKLPHLGDAGRGINRQLPHLGNAGQGIADYISALSARLRRTRVACGDWGRVVTPVCTWRHGLTGVFLDPPYGEGTMNYSAGGNTTDVASKVWAWALENGAHPKMRVVVAAYEDGRDVPTSWTVRPWRARKGYKADGGANARREVLYCSPGCVSVATKDQLDLTGE